MCFYKDPSMVLKRATVHNTFWRSTVDNNKKKKQGVLLTDFSKAFDCLSQLLLAKLHARGFSIPALRLVYNYLRNRKQRTKINYAYSFWEEMLFGVP